MREETHRGLWITAAGLVFCTALGVLLANLGTRTGASAPKPGNVWYATGKDPIACPSRSILDQAVKYNAEGDMHAFNSLLWRGPCTFLNKGEKLFLEDTKLLSGLAKIRRPGNAETYWTFLEAIGHDPSSARANATPPVPQLSQPQLRRLVEETIRTINSASGAVAQALQHKDSFKLQDSAEEPLIKQMAKWPEPRDSLGDAKACFDALCDLKEIVRLERRPKDQEAGIV